MSTPIKEIIEHCDKLMLAGHKSIDIQALKEWCESSLLKKEDEMLNDMWNAGFSNGLG